MAESILTKINDVELPVSQPYTEGMPLTATTAAVLNSVRKDRIINAFKFRLKKMTNATPEEIEEKFLEFESSYELGIRQPSGKKSTISPLEKQMREVARESVAAAMAEKGWTVVRKEPHSPTQITQKKFFALVEAYYASPDGQAACRIEAERRLNSIGSLSIDVLAGLSVE